MAGAVQRLQKQRGSDFHQAVQNRFPIHAQAVILASLAVDREPCHDFHEPLKQSTPE